MSVTHNKTGRSKGRERYIEVPNYLLDSFAWSCLSAHAKVAWIMLMRKYHGSNNGKIGMASRELGKWLNCGHVTASRALNELVTYGFVEIAKVSSFARKRLATEYRMTHLKCDATGELSTKLFMRLTAKPQVKREHTMNERCDNYATQPETLQ